MSKDTLGTNTYDPFVVADAVAALTRGRATLREAYGSYSAFRGTEPDANFEARCAEWNRLHPEANAELEDEKFRAEVTAKSNKTRARNKARREVLAREAARVKVLRDEWMRVNACANPECDNVKGDFLGLCDDCLVEKGGS